jgi:putative heme iron utilization protein
LAEIEKRDEAALEKLAEEINEEHRSFRRAFKATFRSALRAGDLLNEAKEQAGHGNWGAWIEENCEFSERTARVYMRLANNRDKVEEMLKTAEPADLSIEGVLHELATPASTSPVSTWESLADDP